MQNFDEALQDFRAVLEVDADNKAAKNQLAITSHKIKQIHNREKQMYAGMFQKFAEIDAKVSDSDRVICIAPPTVKWFASRCPGRRLSTWPMTGVSCPTALGALCAQLTFRLAWCRQHSAVMAAELLQPPDLACGTLFQSSCVIPTSPTYCSDDS